MSDLAVILPAAGASTRFGTNKLHALLGGRRVIDRTFDAFASRTDVAQIIVVGDATLTGRSKCTTIPGGRCRAESVALAVAAVAPGIEWLAIHDAARPLMSQALIDRTLAAAREFGAAAPALPVALTIKSVDGPLPAFVKETVPRAQLFALQTPQVIRTRDLRLAIERCPIRLEEITDDLQFLELIGLPAVLVAGEERNLKLTTPIDLQLAELLLAEREDRLPPLAGV